MDGIFIDLTILPPTPERLARHLKMFREADFSTVVIDWGGMFPWTCAEGIHAPWGYDEHMVDRISETSEIDLVPVLPLRTRADFILSLPEFSSMRHREYPGFIDTAAPGVLKLFEELIEDLMSLLPRTRRVYTGTARAEPPAVDADFLSAFQRLCSSTGVAEYAPDCGIGDDLLLPPSNLRNWDLAAAPSVKETISDAGSGLFSELFDRFQAECAASWNDVRLCREHLIRGCSPACGAAPLSEYGAGFVGSLEKRIDVLENLYGELIPVSAELVQTDPLRRLLRCEIESLREEYYLLLPRVEQTEAGLWTDQ